MSAKMTDQMNQWMGEFGKNYTDRNSMTLEGMEELYHRNYGITKRELNRHFFKEIRHTARILEVGSNIGNQLLCLEKIGFSNLYGIELQNYAIRKSKSHNIHIITGSAFDIPFKDSYFDLVFTSGLLIHIHPSDVKAVMKEICRCSNMFIVGNEYWHNQFKEVPYRGKNNMLWKADYAKLYLKWFKDLKLIKEIRINNNNSENIDSMFVLKKKI